MVGSCFRIDERTVRLWGGLSSGICIGGLSVGFLGSCGRDLSSCSIATETGKFECWVLDSPQWVSSMPVAENASTEWWSGQLTQIPSMVGGRAEKP